MAKEEKILWVKVFFPAFFKRENFSTKALSVSSENRLGKFDILPQHINFITLIFNKVIIQTSEKEKIEFSFKRGVLIVKENEVKIFLGV